MKFFWKYIIVHTVFLKNLADLLFMPENMQNTFFSFFFFVLAIRYFYFHHQDSNKKLLLNFISDVNINT